MKREQAVLRSLIVVIALMFTTTAVAQVQCKAPNPWSGYDDPNRTESVSDINRIMKRFLTGVELVPPQEADYIRKELAKQNNNYDPERLKKLSEQRYYTTIKLRDAVAVMMQQAEAAERATARRGVASHLIDILYDVNVESTATRYLDEYAKRVPYVEGAFNPARMLMDIAEARFVAATVLRCIVHGL